MGVGVFRGLSRGAYGISPTCSFESALYTFKLCFSYCSRVPIILPPFRPPKLMGVSFQRAKVPGAPSLVWGGAPPYIGLIADS